MNAFLRFFFSRVSDLFRVCALLTSFFVRISLKVFIEPGLVFRVCRPSPFDDMAYLFLPLLIMLPPYSMQCRNSVLILFYIYRWGCLFLIDSPRFEWLCLYTSKFVWCRSLPFFSIPGMASPTASSASACPRPRSFPSWASSFASYAKASSLASY